VDGWSTPTPLLKLQRLKPFEYSPSELKDDEVEVSIECCGLAIAILHVIDDDWKIFQVPISPRHEIVGKITHKGKNVQDLELGQRVGIGWQCGACLTCEFCIKGDETVCIKKSGPVSIGMEDLPIRFWSILILSIRSRKA